MNSIRQYIGLALKRAQLYQHGGYKNAKPLTRNKDDLQAHFFAFLIDVNICLLPVYIWVIEFLLILCGLIPPHFFDLLFYLMFALLFVTCVIVLPLVTAKFKGQSIGYGLMNLRLVQRNKKLASPLHLIMRQVFGFGVPTMVLGYFFKTPGMLIWWTVNGLCALAMPNEQTLFDLVFKIIPVRDPDMNIEIIEDEEEQEEKQEVQESRKRQAPAKDELAQNVSPIDLHIRSNYSDDGCYDVEEIFKMAKNNGMETISITDHNCARVNAAAHRFAHLYHIQYIPGVEFDCVYGQERIRILGYYIDWNLEIFNILEQESLRREKEMSIERVKKFEQYSNIVIDLDSLMTNSRFQTITAQQITEMVFRNRQTRSLPFVKKYLETSANDKEAMVRFKNAVFGKGGPCFVEGKYPSAREIIDAIHDANGIAILSSWHLDYIDDSTIEKLVGLGLDGIECFSPVIQKQTMTALLKIVQRDKLFVSAGSDFHGPSRPGRHLGVTNCPEKGLALVRIFTKAADPANT